MTSLYQQPQQQSNQSNLIFHVLGGAMLLTLSPKIARFVVESFSSPEQDPSTKNLITATAATAVALGYVGWRIYNIRNSTAHQNSSPTPRP